MSKMAVSTLVGMGASMLVRMRVFIFAVLRAAVLLKGGIAQLCEGLIPAGSLGKLTPGRTIVY